MKKCLYILLSALLFTMAMSGCRTNENTDAVLFMKTPVIILSVILLCIVIIALIVLTKHKSNNCYSIDYCGQKLCYSNAKNKYKAGRKVTLYFAVIATDTDYKFTLDGESISYRYDEKKGFVIEFVMPECNVKLECISKNSMIDYISE